MSRPIRGKDRIWQLIEYKSDIAIYAKCKCGYRYCCSVSKKDENGYLTLEQIPEIFYPYCPSCGARKKEYTKEITKMNKHSWDE